MRLRKIEARGFKSFVDKTVLQVGDGIAAIVGPNGCGKSNIIDAIRWSLGEQNPRKLRGERMADLIFAGSESRAPTGLSEVKLTFDDCTDELSGLSGGADVVEVTRRLYRDGDSEYLINRRDARLKDITDLFMDSGVGARAFSIIEQGQIGYLVNARAAERRALIEEAAGITRYRSRRAEAQRKMDRTRQNLERVNDMVAELARQMRSLRRQAAKANRYRRFRLELRRAEVFDGLGRSLALREDLLSARAERGSAERRGGEFEAGLRAEEAAVGALREKVNERNARIEHLKVERAETSARIQVLEQQQVLKREEGERLKARAKALAGELDQLRVRREHLEARNRELSAEREGSKVRLDAALERLAELEKDEAAAAEALRGGVAEVNDVLGALSELRAERAREQADASNLDRNISELRARLNMAQEEWGEIEQSAAEVDSQAAAGRVLLAERKRRVTDLSDELTEVHERFIAVQGELGEAEGTLRRVADELARRRSRLQSLEELQANYEQYGEGVRTVMEFRKAENGASGILGTVAEFIDADAETERAVEAALGEHLQSVVVKEPKSSVRAVELLRSKSKGRGTFVPVEGGMLRHVDGSPAASSGVLGTLRERVSVRSGFEPLADRLLGDALLVESLETGLELLETEPENDRRLVTLLGDVVEPDGTVSGGAAAQKRGGLLSKRRELREVQAKVDTLTVEHEAARTRLEELRSEARDLGARRDDLRAERHKAELELVAAQKDLAQLEHAGKQAVNRQAELTARTSDLKDRIGEVEGLIEQLDGRRESSSVAETQLESRLSELRQQQDELEQALGGARSAVVDSRVETARLRDSDQAVERELRTVANSLTEQERRGERIVTEINEAKERAGVLAAEVVEAGELSARLEGQLVQLGEALAEAQERVARSREELAEREAVLTGLRERLAEAQELRQAASVREATLASQLEHVLSGLRGLLLEPPEELLDRLAEQGAIDVVVQGALPTALGEADDDDGDESAEGEGGVDAETPASGEPPSDEESRTAETRSAEQSEGTVDADARAASAAAEQVPTLHLTIEELRDAERVEDASRRSEELRAKLARMGELNLAAPEDYQVAKERHDFLSAQQEDLETALQDLRNTITKLNKVTRKRFGETFEAVNRELGEVYPALVGGGSAQLTLTDPEDLLETGVELYVRPPGTRLTNVQLMSGGQKAMAAVALLLSVFRVRPSPFCLMDEVDAPLDDANVDRYLNLLRDMSDRTQFVLITHNKRAMEHCDTLYGVTMEEPGVSKIVTVRLSDGIDADGVAEPMLDPTR